MSEENGSPKPNSAKVEVSYQVGLEEKAHISEALTFLLGNGRHIGMDSVKCYSGPVSCLKREEITRYA